MISIGPSVGPSLLTRSGCNSGNLLVAVGAMLFAGTNAAATGLYRRGGGSVVSLFVLRAPFIYVVNGALAGLQGGGPAATRVLLLRTGSWAATRLALTRSILNSLKACLLSVAFMFMTYADAFTVFKGVGVLSTSLVARGLLGEGERLSCSEMACGSLTLVGITLIAQPPTLFGAWYSHQTPPPPISRGQLEQSWEPHPSSGLALASVAGALSAISGTLVRLLSRERGPHEGKTPPSMLLSFLIIVMLVVFGSIALVCRFAGIADMAGFEWSAFVWPGDRTDWALIAVHCACTLGGHLATASAYTTTRAGMVAFLQLTEIPWVYVLDVAALSEPMSPLASLGCMVVFLSAVAAALLAGSNQSEGLRAYCTV
mmetsp:Transcript_11776/g.20116  ORF Transcript_11776/g.20116 Transcript_11776/m.20116 type:complete len:371 (+) Transcript_11776:89-1201(+)